MANIYAIGRAHRREVVAGNNAALLELTRAYGPIYQRIQEQVAQIRLRNDLERAAGIDPSVWHLLQEQRLVTLQYQVEQQVRAYTAQAEPVILENQRQAAILGAEHTGDQLAAGIKSPRRGITTALSSLSREDILSQVGFLTDGSPLHELLSELGPEAARAVGKALTTGEALGHGALEIARDIRQAMGMALDRALTITRTEGLRTYREAGRATADRNADITKGWIWSSSLDGSTCAACLGMQGTFHDPHEEMDSHVNCRCSMTWVTKSWEELGFPGVPNTNVTDIESGQHWLEGQTAEHQRAVLGNAAAKAFADGRFTLPDLVGIRRNDTWGNSVYQKALKDVIPEGLAGLYQRNWSRPSAPAAAITAPPTLGSITRLIDFPGVGPQSTAAFRGIEAIAEVHDVPTNLRPVQMRESHTTDFHGAYSWDAASGDPTKIEVSDVFNGHMAATMVHETGHYLDHQALGPAPGTHGSLAATRHQGSPEMQGVMAAIDSSEAVHQIQLLGVRGWPDRIRAQTSIPSPNHLRYISQPHELFARAYMQYIATKTGNRQLLNELQNVIDEERDYPHQWTADDFKPILKEFDRLFRKKGWLKEDHR